MNLSLEEKRIACTLNEACLYLKELLDEGASETYEELYRGSLSGDNNDASIEDVPIRIYCKEWREREPYIYIILCGAYRVREGLRAIFSTFQVNDDLLASLESTINPFFLKRKKIGSSSPFVPGGLISGISAEKKRKKRK